jgi:hypothetical protein
MRCLPSDVRLYAVTGLPQCCGFAMELVLPRPDSNRRKGERRKARGDLLLVVQRDAAKVRENIGAGLNNISLQGAGLRLTAPVSIDEKLELTILRADEREAARVQAAVRWSKPIGGGLYAVGVAFDRKLTLIEFAHMV